MGIHGTLTTMSVSDLLQFLATGRKTGTLKFGRGKVVKEIYFQNGLIIGSNTNDPKEYLGQVLIHYGKLDESQLQAAMETQRSSGGKLGQILIARRLLSEAAVLEILKIRTLDIIYDLFIWEEAHFEFFDNESPPDDLIRISVEPTNVIMEGIYRIDELARYRQLIPSDRTVLELGAGWTSTLNTSKELRQILYFVEKRMSVAEICYHMHASAFHVYGQLYTLISEGVARVAGEAPEEATPPVAEVEDLPETVTEMIWAAERKLEADPEAALLIVQKALQQQPNNPEAQSLLPAAEEKFVKHVYQKGGISPRSVPRLRVSPSDLTNEAIDPQEGFVLSRINGSWDIQSILSICPFREADCLRMIQKLIEREIVEIQ